jgi:uncharacterized protein YunC (DUF1805 family)
MQFTDFETFSVPLKLPLLIIKGRRGLLACGYLDSETCNKTGEAVAVVSGVKNFDDMALATVTKVSAAATALGLKPGMRGVEVLEVIR